MKTFSSRESRKKSGRKTRKGEGEDSKVHTNSICAQFQSPMLVRFPYTKVRIVSSVDSALSEAVTRVHQAARQALSKL